jgi:endonuclease/exonuclease/phosphatase family metal-dependent hydrolase
MTTLDSSLVFATYNVHGCVGLDGVVDVARIADVLADLDADVIALQEVLAGREGVDGQLAELAVRLGMDAVVGSTMQRGQCRYGNALLSRLPISDVRVIDLSVAGYEPRCLLHARVEFGGSHIDVFNTHLGLRVRERHAQIRACHRVLDDDPVLPQVMMGDFNAWLPRGDVLGPLRARFGAQPAPRSFPCRRPVFALDRIWTRPRAWLQEIHVGSHRHARVASDHLPVWARVETDLVADVDDDAVLPLAG